MKKEFRGIFRWTMLCASACALLIACEGTFVRDGGTPSGGDPSSGDPYGSIFEQQEGTVEQGADHDYNGTTDTSYYPDDTYSDEMLSSDSSGGYSDGDSASYSDTATASDSYASSDSSVVPDSDPGSEEGPEVPGDGELQPGQVTASEWNDLNNWDEWLALLDGEFSFYETAWGFVTRGRIPVKVVDGAGSPIADAETELSCEQEGIVWRARTDVAGHADLFNGIAGTPAAGPCKVIARYYEKSASSAKINGPVTTPIALTLNTAEHERDLLDLMLLFDTTGSMSDELEYIKAEMKDVILRVKENEAKQLRVRLSLNFYRDEGDEYVVLPFPFSEDIDESVTILAAQSANGGGDMPEAVHTAFLSAIDHHEWSAEARMRLLFWIHDAPPHEFPEVIESLQGTLSRAAAKGIRIIPVAASGADKNEEFIARSFDIFTGGTYVFITDDSGIGGDHGEPSGEVEAGVEYLNDLIVRLIGEYLSGENR